MESFVIVSFTSDKDQPLLSSIPFFACHTRLFIMLCYQKRCRARASTKSRFQAHLGAKKKIKAGIQRALETRKQEKKS